MKIRGFFFRVSVGLLSFFLSVHAEQQGEGAVALPLESVRTSRVDDTVPSLPPVPVFKTIPIPEYKGPLTNISAQQAYMRLKRYAIARDVGNMVKLMKGVPADKARDIATLVCMQETELTVDEKARFIVGLIAQHFADKPDAYQPLLAVLKECKLQPIMPLPIIAAVYGYTPAIKPIIAWAQDIEKHNKKGFEKLAFSAMHALTYAIQHNDIKLFSTLIGAGMSISPAQAGTLLFIAAQGKDTSGNFIAKLVHLGADINGADAQGYTPLMRATVAGNGALVKTLVKAGARINYFVDTAVGTALQLAIEHKQLAIEEFLRAHGAHE